MARKIAELRILRDERSVLDDGRPGARRQPVHPLRRHPQGPAALVERARPPARSPSRWSTRSSHALRERGVEVATGRFGAMMAVEPGQRRAGHPRRGRLRPATRGPRTLSPGRHECSSARRRAPSRSSSGSPPSRWRCSRSWTPCATGPTPTSRRASAPSSSGRSSPAWPRWSASSPSTHAARHLGILAVVGAAVYLADVRPALRQVSGRGSSGQRALRPLVSLAQTGPVTSLVDGPGGALEVLTTGSGLPSTVFAHGLAGSIETTRPFGSGVAGSRTFFSFRGHGASAAPETDWTYAALAAELDAVARHVGATRALGVSMGAGALCSLLEQQPDRFDRLVLVIPAVVDRPRDGRGDGPSPDDGRLRRRA